MAKTGKLIVIEGSDCSGKETQSKLLVKKLNAMGIKAINFSFPMYDTASGKIVGGPILGKKEISECWFEEGPVNLDPKIFCLYLAADRKYNFPKIKEYLDNDYYVVLDRYVSSNMAHQGAKIEDPDERFNLFKWIDKLEYWLLELPKADLTIFLHVPYNITKELQKNRVDLDQNEKDPSYQINTVKTYIELAELYNWTTINCSKDDEIRDIEDINQEIIDIVLK
mgnify:CR=1 FL=1